MKDDHLNPITSVLLKVTEGADGASEELLELVYAELRKIASARLAGLKPGQTIQATALVHEAWIKLGAGQAQAWDSRAHYFGAAANAMRNILIDHARSKTRRKREAPGTREELSVEWAAPTVGAEFDLLELDEHLSKLGEEHERAQEIVMLRYFAGLTVNEVAEALGMSPRSVDREWLFARTWLRRSMAEEASRGG